MNERIRELADRLWRIHPKDIDAMGLKTRKEFYEQELKKFAELILQEHVELLKQRWYTLNNTKPPSDESPRDIGMRVGQKIEVQQCIQLLLNHWKDRSDDPTTERQQDS